MILYNTNNPAKAIEELKKIGKIALKSWMIYRKCSRYYWKTTVYLDTNSNN